MMTSLKGNLMLLHYGNCKSKIRELEETIEELRKENSFRKGRMLMYEQEIDVLIPKLSDTEILLKGKNCAFDTLTKENENLNQIISCKDETITKLKHEIAQVVNDTAWSPNNKKSKRK